MIESGCHRHPGFPTSKQFERHGATLLYRDFGVVHSSTISLSFFIFLIAIAMWGGHPLVWVPIALIAVYAAPPRRDYNSSDT